MLTDPIWPSDIPLNPAIKTPLYHQIFVHLRNAIEAGHIPAGARLPGEHQIAAHAGVSRITAKRAVNELAAAGLVIRERGRGTRVRAPRALRTVHSSAESWLDGVSAMSAATDVRVLAFDYRPADAETADALKLEPQATVQHAVRIRYLDGEPLSHLTTCLPERVGRAFTRDDLARYPLLALLERGGVAIGRARQSITASLADTALADALAVHVGAPLMTVARIVYDQDDRPIEYLRAHYRPDRYQIEMDLARIGDEKQARWVTVARQTGD